jgi:hypothetical protein
MGNLSLVVAREPPSTTTVLAQKDRSFTCCSRVELALLPRLSLTRLSRTQSLFLFGGGGSFFTLFLLPAGSAATKVQIII